MPRFADFVLMALVVLVLIGGLLEERNARRERALRLAA